MRTSITNARRVKKTYLKRNQLRNQLKKHGLFYKILAAAIWVLVWQLAKYVAEAGDTFGISCFCYKKTYRIDYNG